MRRLRLFSLALLLLAGCATARSTRMIEGQVYTHGTWHVKPGREADFIAAWKDLGKIFAELPNASGKGILIQSTTDPTLFYSFGPWKSLEDVAAMRADARAQAGIRRLADLCTEASPGTFRVVAESQ